MAKTIVTFGEIMLRLSPPGFSVRTPGKLLAAKRVVRAVEDVSLDLVGGQVLAVVGESGSGKSVLARMLARIVTPTSGDLVLQGKPIAIKSKRTLDYASQVQLVLQDPFASMNPVHRMSHNLLRPLLIHGASKQDAPGLAEAALRRVSLEPPSRFLESYPHELSGGQLQHRQFNHRWAGCLAIHRRSGNRHRLGARRICGARLERRLAAQGIGDIAQHLGCEGRRTKLRRPRARSAGDIQGSPDSGNEDEYLRRFE